MPSRSAPRKSTASVEARGIQIEIVLAQPERTRSLTLSLPPGATVADAVNRAAECTEFSEVNWQATPLGIFGRLVSGDQVLKQGDRVEIYRPLAADPKTARRKRVASRSGRS
jgi:putative ubiquitin-RnfH superfamily antitoxin RatB of RatAB toxin-antitoxin module